MKSYPIFLLFLLSLFVFSCTDNLSDIGSGIQPLSDQITVKPDTFHLASQTVFVDYIYSKPDSFLLGTYYDTKFGSTKAEILAQVNCPVGFKFPPLSVPDSASVVLLYNSWFGSKDSPLDVNIYEMNKGTFNFSQLYQSNLNASDYADQSDQSKLSERIFSAKDVVRLRADTTAIIFPLNSAFVKRFFNDSYFASTNTFLNQFKGMYITANYGSATLLNIAQINLRYYYHYTYVTRNVHGGDSTVTVNNNLFFPANSEVRQVNRFLHLDRATVVKPADSVNYVASPANLDANIVIPLNRINTRMNDSIKNKKNLTINSAVLKVEATDINVDTVSAPTVRYMLLIKEEAINRFFNNKELPSDTCAVLASHSVALVVNTTNVYEDYYKFSIAKLIANELKIAKQNKTVPVDALNLRLIPVQVTMDASSNITSVKQDNLMSTVTIRSGKNPYSPLRLNLVYSGF
jgi:hypothetical protein